MWKTGLWSLGWEDPLEKRKLQTLVFRPGEFRGLYSPQGCKELDTTERLSPTLYHHHQLKCMFLKNQIYSPSHGAITSIPSLCLKRPKFHNYESLTPHSLPQPLTLMSTLVHELSTPGSGVESYCAYWWVILEELSFSLNLFLFAGTDAKNTRRNCTKKDLNELDNYDDVVNHPEPDILEWEVKWALRPTAVNKVFGCNGIPVELFKTLKDDIIKVLHSLCQQIWKTQHWPRTGQHQSLSQFPRRVVLKNVQTIRQLYSPPMLQRSYLKSCMLGFSIMWT